MNTKTKIKQKVLAAVLTIVALAAGQNAMATTKTVTYKITSVESIDLNYDIVFTRSGDAPFDTSAPTTYTATVPTSSIGQTSGGAGGFSVVLADGLSLQLQWGNGSNVSFTSNCILPVAENKYITYTVSCSNTHYYFVTHVMMTGMESAYQYGMLQYPNNERIDYDYDSEWGFLASYQSRSSFGQITITYTDTPKDYSITYVDAVNGEGGVINPNPTSYNVTTAGFQITAPIRIGYISSLTYTDAQHTSATAASLPMTISQGEAGTRKDITFFATWNDVWGMADGADGSAEHPYIITTTAGLDLLASLVNTGNDFSGKVFKLGDNITYDGTENNYTAIGTYIDNNHIYSFNGTFDGDGHTISGINVNRTGQNTVDNYIGLFGYIRDGGTVQNVVLASSTFTGYHNIGGIVGCNFEGTVSNCRVESSVTINAGTTGSIRHGGIVGSFRSSAKVIGCVSAAKIRNNNMSGHIDCGGITGYNNSSSGTIRDCLYTGDTVEATENKGAISGFSQDVRMTYTNNYYTSVSIGGVKGSDQDGARCAYTVTLGENITLVGDETAYNVSGLTAIGTTVLRYNGTLYSGEGQTLTLGYTGLPDGYHTTFSYNDGSDHAISGNTLTMPASNVTVNSTGGSVANTYYVSFNANGGTGTMSNQTFTYGEAQNLTANAFTRSGYALTGWSTTKNGIVEYTDGQSVSNLTTEHLATVTLYAQWTPDFATHWHADGDHDGTTAERAYIITSTAGLDLLANLVNGGNTYSDTFFKLGDNITYHPTTTWDDANSQENNYTAIGTYIDNSIKQFKGTLDGCGHTISGIRIYKGNTNSADNYQGLFGDFKGTVKNLTLSDARITGRDNVGGIVGCNNGTVENCHATATVCIHTVKYNSDYHGGIVGYNSGTTSGCTSAATLTIKDGVTNCLYYGGIVGNRNDGSVQYCLALGVVIPSVTNAGAIVGNTDKNGIERNFYHGCTVGGKTTNIGGGNGDMTSQVLHRAIPGYTVTYATGVSEVPGTSIASYDYDGLTVYQYGDNYGITYKGTTYYAAGITVTLSYTGGSETFTMPDCDVIPLLNGFDNTSVIATGSNTGSEMNVILTNRTLYKDGYWNTLCLPFDVIDGDETDNVSFTGTPLEGATVMKLTASTSNLTNGTLTLNFENETTTMTAGTPYIIKWDRASDYATADRDTRDLKNPVFTGVTIDATDRKVAISDNKVTFMGSYDAQTFSSTNSSILFLGTYNSLYYPEAGAKIGACRAYFEISGGGQGVKSFVLNFDDDETTSISLTPNPSPVREGSAGAWYDLQGRKMKNERVKSEKLPRGIYIHNGKKVVIK